MVTTMGDILFLAPFGGEEFLSHKTQKLTDVFQFSVLSSRFFCFHVIGARNPKLETGKLRTERLLLKPRGRADAVFVPQMEAVKVGVINLKYSEAGAETKGGTGALFEAGPQRAAALKGPDFPA